MNGYNEKLGEQFHLNSPIKGCYIPYDWAKDFEKEYLDNIKYYCLILSENYVKNHFADIKGYANVIEDRGDDEDCTLESVLVENAKVLELAQMHDVNYVLIDDKYEIDIDL